MLVQAYIDGHMRTQISFWYAPWGTGLHYELCSTVWIKKFRRRSCYLDLSDNSLSFIRQSSSCTSTQLVAKLVTL
jgi:hypothetical protein